MTNTLDWKCTGPDKQWDRQVMALLPAIGDHLDLATYFWQVHIIADDSPEEDPCWFQVRHSSGEKDNHLALELYCAAPSFAPSRPLASTVETEVEIWEISEGPYAGPVFDPLDFSISQAEIFLYHNLLLARDLITGEVKPHALPKGQAQAFEAAWEVVVDGRLSRMGLPGYSLASRRGKFSHLFSSAGVLMPSHWHIFQSLWDGGLASSKEVLAIIRQLPTLC